MLVKNVNFLWVKFLRIDFREYASILLASPSLVINSMSCSWIRASVYHSVQRNSRSRVFLLGNQPSWAFRVQEVKDRRGNSNEASHTDKVYIYARNGYANAHDMLKFMTNRYLFRVYSLKRDWAFQPFTTIILVKHMRTTNMLKLVE